MASRKHTKQDATRPTKARGRKDKTGAYEALLGSVNMRAVSERCAVRYFGRGWTALISPEKSLSVGISNKHRPTLLDAHT